MSVQPCPVCGWTMNLRGFCANCGYEATKVTKLEYDNKVEGDK